MSILKANRIENLTTTDGGINVNNSGNVGVGTASPSAPLHVNAGTTNNALFVDSSDSEVSIGLAASDGAVRLLQSSGGLVIRTGGNANAFGTGDNERLRIDSSGNVGIGTTTLPGLFSVHESASSANYINITNGATGASSWSNGMLLGPNSSGDALVWQNENAALRFGTNNTDRMRIDNSGNVGIGTNSPQKFVHVSGAGSSNVVTARIQQSTTNTPTDGGALLELGGTRSDGTYGFYGGIKGGRRNNASDNTGYLAFFSDNNDGQSLAERARIDNSGRLLVGTTSYSSAATVVLQGNSSNSGEDAVLRLNRGGTPGANADLGFISFGDNAGNLGASIRSANSSSSSWGTNDYPGNLTFHTTADGGSSPTERMKISYDGSFRVQGVYDNTVSSSANVHVDSGGLIRRATSSAKYKTNIETIEDSYADALLNCRPVWYQSTCEGDNPDHGWWGFIAEEVAEIDPRLVHWKTTNVTYDEDGRAVEAPCDPEAEGVLYDRFVPHLVNLVRRQKTRIETLETQNTAQQTQIDDLLARVTALETAS